MPEGSFIWVRLDMPGGEIVDTVKYSIEKMMTRRNRPRKPKQ